MAVEALDRESEFTGVKGTVLKYAGCTYATIIAGQFVEAIALRAGVAAATANTFALIVTMAAFGVYPLGVSIARLAGARHLNA